MTKRGKINLLRQKDDDKYNHIGNTAEVVLTFFVLLGFFSAFRDVMYASIVLWVLMCVCVLILGLRYISERFKNFEKVLSFGIYIISMLCFFIFFLAAVRGFLGAVNRFIILWNFRFDTDGRMFSVGGDSVFNSIVFWTLAAVPLTSLLFTLVKKRMRGCVITVIIAGMLFGFILGRSSMLISVVCMICGILGIIIFSLTPRRRIGIGGVVCISLTFIMFGGIFFLARGYSGSESIALWKDEISKQIEKIRYGEDTLPKGVLKDADSLLKGDETTLKVTMSYPQSLYLIGFVGGIYTGGEWKTLNKEAYQNEYDGLMEWLEQEGISPMTQYSVYNKLSEEEEEYDEEYNTVKIENKGAYRKFMYLPYSVVSWSGGSSETKKDWQVQSDGIFGASEYEFENVIDAPNADGIMTEPWIQFPKTEEQRKYTGVESVYHHFAQDKYMDIDYELKTLIYKMFFPENNGENMDFNEITTQIRTVLRKETQYREFPPTMGKGKDFIRWFLTEAKSGNAVHYASAAVMAYRAAGYPARYVEGYLCQEEKTPVSNENGEITAILTNKNAHAWAEVYVSGVGWVPVEVVPGMYVETYTNQIVEGKPAYQVSSKQNDDGVDVDSDDIDGEREDVDEEETDKGLSFGEVFPVGVLLILYTCFFLYLILESQRTLRILYKKKLEQRLCNEKLVCLYANEIQKTLQYAGVKGNYNHPFELTNSVDRKFRGISKNRYERAISLIHKVRFGGKELRKDEKYALSCFVLKLKKELYKNKGFFGRLKLRYGYAVEK